MGQDDSLKAVKARIGRNMALLNAWLEEQQIPDTRDQIVRRLYARLGVAYGDVEGLARAVQERIQEKRDGEEP